MANRSNDYQKLNHQPRYDANAAYNLSSFEVERPRRTYEAPERYRKPELKVADERQPKTRQELRSEEVRSYKVSAKVVVVAVVLFAMLAAVLYGESTKNQLTREISKIEKQLEIAQSENTRLNMELGALVSIDQIEQYATEKLGMVKMNKYQIEYVDTAAAQTAETENEAAAAEQDEASDKNAAPEESNADAEQNEQNEQVQE